jgi:hypothetical protein
VRWCSKPAPTIALRRMQPNGPDCDPTTYAAILETTEAADLVPG